MPVIDTRSVENDIKGDSMKKQYFLLFLLCSMIISTIFCAEMPQQSYWQQFKNWISGKSYYSQNNTDDLKKKNDIWTEKRIKMHHRLISLDEFKRKALYTILLRQSQFIDTINTEWATNFINQLTKEDKQFLKLALAELESESLLNSKYDKEKGFWIFSEQIETEINNFYSTLPELKQYSLIKQKLEPPLTLRDPKMIKFTMQQQDLVQQLENLPFYSMITQLLHIRDSYFWQQKIDPIKIKAVSIIIDELLRNELKISILNHLKWQNDAWRAQVDSYFKSEKPLSLPMTVIFEQIRKEAKNLYINVPELKRLAPIEQKLESLHQQRVELFSKPTNRNQWEQMFKSIKQQEQSLYKQSENSHLLSIIISLLQTRDSYFSQQEIDPIKIRAFIYIIDELITIEGIALR
jgi:hypothetical protein